MKSKKEESKDLDCLKNQLFFVFQTLNDQIFGCALKDIELKCSFENKVSLSFEKECLIFGPGILSFTHEDFFLLFLHEMVHALNYRRDIKDTGRNSYHNKKFLSECLNRGSFVIKHRNQGWSILSLDFPRNVTEANCVFQPEHKPLLRLKNSIATLSSGFDWASFYSARSLFQFKKDYSYKYTCSCSPPFNSIRSGRSPHGLNPLITRCEICGSLFVCQHG